MGYVANIQFSPFYVAKELEYFQSAGFDVTFDYRWETDGIQLVAAGELPFTIASGDQVIQARSQELPVKAIAAWYQEYPVAIISSEDINLDKPEDLRNLKIGIPETFGASYIGLRALLKAGNLTENDIDLQVIGYTQLALLTSGQIDAAVVYANNESVVLSQQGYGFNILYVSDYSDIVSAVLVSSDTYISENPDAVSSFVNAFLQGLSDVMSEPDTAFEISTGYVEGLEDNKDTQRAVLDASMEIWKTEFPGHMNEAAWANAQNIMFQAGLIEKTLPHEQFYTNEFIP
jgi:NitT/TauT family transport system substrate-binding protein